MNWRYYLEQIEFQLMQMVIFYVLADQTIFVGQVNKASYKKNRAEESFYQKLHELLPDYNDWLR